MAFDDTRVMTPAGFKADPVDVHVGRRIRARRKELHVTQEGLADILKLTFQQVQKYERGMNRVSASKLFAIAQALRVPVGYFFEGLDAEGHATPNARVADQLLADGLGWRLATAFLGLPPQTPATRYRQSLVTIAESLVEAASDAGER